MTKRILIFLGVFFLALHSTPSFAQKEYIVMGTMQHTDIEGGCWYLQAKLQKYELTGSQDIMQRCHIEGRQLVLNVKDASVKHSICMIGKIVEVVDILDSVIHPHDPPVYEKLIKGTVHKTKNGCWYVLTAGKHKFEFRLPIPKQFMRIGARYNRLTKLIPGGEGNCEMEGVITISMLEPDMQPKHAKEKKNDPR